jgi:hypothetical protein
MFDTKMKECYHDYVVEEVGKHYYILFFGGIFHEQRYS